MRLMIENQICPRCQSRALQTVLAQAVEPWNIIAYCVALSQSQQLSYRPSGQASCEMRVDILECLLDYHLGLVRTETLHRVANVWQLSLLAALHGQQINLNPPILSSFLLLCPMILFVI